MTGPATADGFVAGIGHTASSIAGHHPTDSAKVLEDSLEAPKASTAQCGRFLRHAHVHLLLGGPIIYALSPSVTPAPAACSFGAHETTIHRLEHAPHRSNARRTFIW